MNESLTARHLAIIGVIVVLLASVGGLIYYTSSRRTATSQAPVDFSVDPAFTVPQQGAGAGNSPGVATPGTGPGYDARPTGNAPMPGY